MGRPALVLALAVASCCASAGLSFAPLATNARSGSGHRRVPSSGGSATTTRGRRTPPATIIAADRTTDGGRGTAHSKKEGGEAEANWLSTESGGAVDQFNAVSVKAVKGVIDVLMCDRPFARFYALETIARVPYFGAFDGAVRRVSHYPAAVGQRLRSPSRPGRRHPHPPPTRHPPLPPSLSAYLSVLHLRETLGIWRHPELLELHFSGELVTCSEVTRPPLHHHHHQPHQPHQPHHHHPHHHPQRRGTSCSTCG